MKTTVELYRDFLNWVQTLDPNQFLVREYGYTRFVDRVNMPEIYIGSTKFNFITTYKTCNNKGDMEFILNYQSDEQILYSDGSGQWPLLDIGILEHITKGGKVKWKIIDRGTWRTKLS